MNLLLLDKDGTLATPASGAIFVNAPYDQALLPGAKEAIANYTGQGWRSVIVSNQDGVATGHKTLENCFLEMRYILELLPEVSEAYFCPDFEGEICWRCWGDCSEAHRIQYSPDCSEFEHLWRPPTFRKPDPGMLWLASEHHRSSRGDEVLMVGDRPEDQDAARTFGVGFKWADEFRGK